MSLPQRFSLSSVSRFVPILAQVLSDHPFDVLAYQPSLWSLSEETFACRLRDAAKAILSNMQSDDRLPVSRLREVWPCYSVSISGNDLVTIRNKTPSVPRPAGLHQPGSAIEQLITQIDEPRLRALCLLLATRDISGPYRLQGCSPILIQTITPEYDVSVKQEGDEFVLF